MTSGCPCSRPPCRVKPHGAPPCSRASTSTQPPPPPPRSPPAAARWSLARPPLAPLSMAGRGALTPGCGRGAGGVTGAKKMISPSRAHFPSLILQLLGEKKKSRRCPSKKLRFLQSAFPKRRERQVLRRTPKPAAGSRETVFKSFPTGQSDKTSR